MKHKAFQLHSFKALDEEKGVFEAIVAVFNNVDRGRDRILPGAFADSLKAWEAKGRPIPVIFSHEWNNLDAHIGQVVEAKEAEEGLYVKAQLDMDEPFAQRVYKKMRQGTLAEFSFAYDIVESVDVKVDDRWITELRKLDLLEVGPCLVGMNPETQLLGVKEGRRNATKDAARIQTIHDLCVDLGAKCAEPEPNDTDGETEKHGKPSGKTGTLAERVALELLEMGIE